MNIIKKYSELTQFEIIDILNSILSDESAITNSYMREAYKQIYLLNFWSDFDFVECKDENGALDVNKASAFVESNPKVYKQFEKAFGKANLAKVEAKLEQMASEKLHILNIEISKELDKKIKELDEITKSALTSFESISKNPQQLELMEKLVKIGAQEELKQIAREQVKDELAKKKAEKENG